MADYIIIAILAVIIFFSLRSIIRSHRKGQCSGGCAGCPGCAGCSACTGAKASKAVTENRGIES